MTLRPELLFAARERPTTLVAAGGSWWDDSRVTDEQRLGLAVVTCDGDDGKCPGMTRQLIVNDPASGRPPRGFFVRPRGCLLSDVEVVVIGANPGKATGFERRLNRLVVGHPDRFDIMAEASADASTDEPYYVQIDRLLRLLWPDGRDRAILWAEVVYCETKQVPDPKRPGELMDAPFHKAIPFCSSRHLEQQLAVVPKTVTVICNGGPATEWFADWADRTQFPGLWMSVDHSSGSWTFKKLFQDEALAPSVQANWERLKRDRKPIRLFDGSELKLVRGSRGRVRVLRLK